MTFGENPKKVRNIVDGNVKAFQELYRRKIQVSTCDGVCRFFLFSICLIGQRVL